MTDTTQTRTAREELEHWVSEKQRWEKAERDDRAKLAALNAGAAERVLDDPGAAESVASEAGRLAAHADLATQAAQAAEGRAHRARLRIVAEEADRMEADLEPARQELAAHESKTERLRKALEAHTVSEWREWDADRQIAEAQAATRDGSGTLGRVFHNPKAYGMRDKIKEVERRIEILRTVAAEQPVAPLIGYGESESELFPDVIVPARGGVIAPIGFEQHYWINPQDD